MMVTGSWVKKAYTRHSQALRGYRIANLPCLLRARVGYRLVRVSSVAVSKPNHPELGPSTQD